MTGTDRILTEAACVELAQRMFGMQQGGGETVVRLVSYWGGHLRWGRNRVTLATDQQETRVEIWRRFNRAAGHVVTNQLDAAGLEAAVRKAEQLARYDQVGADNLRAPYLFTAELPRPAIWSDATYNLTAETRGEVARTLIDPAEQQGLLSAGHLAAEAQAYATMSSQGHRLYARMSQAQCAMTVRDVQGTGSGWAGKSSYDWSKINGPALAERALRKCMASRNPVALEPGRYTAILEPQAVADLLEVLGFDRPRNEGREPAPFWMREGFSKLGLKVADERVTIGQDPLDPALGALPFAGGIAGELGDPYRTVNWIENGVLTGLAYGRPYALSQLNENLGAIERGAFRMRGGATSVEEMIATTKRGLLVTRLWGVRVLESASLLSSGFTRDGLWLIENGKITKPVKNFRFVESPLFALNQLEQLGPAESAFRPGPEDRDDGDPLLRPAVVPPLKVRDFNFTALVDAV